MHQQPDGQERLRKATRMTIINLLVNLVLSTLKIITGMLTGMHALLAGGIHSLSDLVSGIITLITLRLSRGASGLRTQCSYRQIESIGTLVVSVVLSLTGIGLIVDAFHAHDKAIIDEYLILVIALASLAVIIKEALFRLTFRLGAILSSRVLVANAWTHRGDAISSLAILVSAIISIAYPHLRFVDAFTTVLISGMILRAAWEIAEQSLNELQLLSRTLSVLTLVEAALCRFPELTLLSDPRIRSTGGLLSIDLPVEADPGCTIAHGHEVAEKIRREVATQTPRLLSLTLFFTPRGAAGGTGGTAMRCINEASFVSSLKTNGRTDP